MKHHLFHVTRHVFVRLCLITAGLFLTILTLSTPVLAVPKIYWIHPSTGTMRVDPDGSNLEYLEIGGGMDIALDAGAGKVYMADFGDGGLIHRMNSDGSNVETVIDLDRLDSRMYDIALDLNAGKIYWVFGRGLIQRANLDGSDIEDLVYLPAESRVYGLALDVEAGKMYWTDQETHTIQRADLDGANREDVLTLGSADEPSGEEPSDSDEFFADGILDYQSPDVVDPGQTLELEFDVIVQDLAPHDWVIGNVALITASLDPQDLSGYAVTFETNRVEVRVENPIPEPSTFLFLATGLLAVFALERRRRKMRK